MPNKHLTFAQKYIFGAMLIITLALTAVFFNHHSRIERLTESVMRQQARALFSQLILTRRWVSSHGGVFVKVRPGVDPNPFLSIMAGMKVTITADDGSLYTLRNPGLVVREISQLAEESGIFKFHVASLDPVNPINSQPDNFERQALLSFEAGENEAFNIEDADHGPIYRYMAPLKFEERCNKCHAFQALELGDIRGGISISIPMAEIKQQLEENRLVSIYSAILVTALLFAMLALLAYKFMHQLQAAQSELERQATTDSLTGLLNRKSAFEHLEQQFSQNRRHAKPLSCLLIDVDLFKRINDLHGHLAGDKVLSELASTFKQISRRYDILCRYGGEEFLIILPGTQLSTAVKVAEKYLQAASSLVVTFEQQEIHLTVSIGVTEALLKQPEVQDNFIDRADKALYQAKELGRNRVVTLPG